MPKPPEERIAEELVRRLGQVVVSEDQQIRLAKVYRVNRDATDWTPDNNTIVVKQGLASRIPESDYPGNPPAIAYELSFMLIGFIRQSDRETKVDDSEINTIVALMKRAVTPDSDWHNFDGVSFDAVFGEVQPFVADGGGNTGAMVELFVRYRVSEYDPFLVRA